MYLAEIKPVQLLVCSNYSFTLSEIEIFGIEVQLPFIGPQHPIPLKDGEPSVPLSYKFIGKTCFKDRAKFVGASASGKTQQNQDQAQVVCGKSGNSF